MPLHAAYPKHHVSDPRALDESPYSNLDANASRRVGTSMCCDDRFRISHCNTSFIWQAPDKAASEMFFWREERVCELRTLQYSVPRMLPL